MGWKEIERHIIKMTNDERKKNHRKPLKYNKKLKMAATDHSRYMCNKKYLGHDGHGGSKPWDRAKRRGYSSGYVGENCYHYPFSKKRSDKQTAKLLVRGWMKSPGHKRNILNTNYTDIGVSVVRKLPRGNTYYVTQVFGRTYPKKSTRKKSRRESKLEKAAKITANCLGWAMLILLFMIIARAC